MYQGFVNSLHSRCNRGMGFQRCSQDTPVPVAKPFSFNDMRQYDIQVPNGEEVPMGCEYLMSNSLRGNTFTCMDGTVLDINSGKVLKKGNVCEKDGVWSERTMNMNCSYGKTWTNDAENPFAPHAESTLGDDDIEYRKYSEIKNREVIGNMTEEQKRLLKDLDDGLIMRKTRLTEVQDL